MSHNLDAMLGSAPVSIMGILNLTPDSFSDGGKFDSFNAAVERADALLLDGAQILDIGGESTAPGASSIGPEEELRRIEPLLRALSARAFLSVDTFRATTAARALASGARMINDVSAMRFDKEMAAVVKDFSAYVCLMYSKESGECPHATRTPKEYADVILSVKNFLDAQISYALSQGINETAIILDPGMGVFVSPNPSYSWELLSRLEELVGYFKAFPVLVGTSRKGFLGGEVAERDPLSQLTALHAVKSGAKIIRTHNVKMLNSFLSAEERLSLSPRASQK